MASDEATDISVLNLTYSHTNSASPSLLDISLHLPRGSRTILIGANGGRLKPLLLHASLTQLLSWEIHIVADLGGEKTRNSTRR
jgi:CCR4-NOT complex subunit CAF16